MSQLGSGSGFLVWLGLLFGACGGEVVATDAGGAPSGHSGGDASVTPLDAAGSGGATWNDAALDSAGPSGAGGVADAPHGDSPSACNGLKVVDAFGTLAPVNTVFELRLACAAGATVAFKGHLIYPTGEDVWDTFYGTTEQSGAAGVYRLRASELGEAPAVAADREAGWFAIVWHEGKAFAVGRSAIVESSTLHLGAMTPGVVPAEVLKATFEYE